MLFRTSLQKFQSTVIYWGSKLSRKCWSHKILDNRNRFSCFHGVPFFLILHWLTQNADNTYTQILVLSTLFTALHCIQTKMVQISTVPDFPALLKTLLLLLLKALTTGAGSFHERSPEKLISFWKQGYTLPGIKSLRDCDIGVVSVTCIYSHGRQ